MNIGMLWLDDDKRRTFEEKVKRAAEYYSEKYGRFPELCLVNTAMLAGDTASAESASTEANKKVGRIEVQPTQTVLLHHFWLGMKTN
jgi:hypothetical protein